MWWRVDKTTPIIVWFRRDLRLSDHAALTAAAATGQPIIPLFIRDEQVDSLGAAPKWRLHQSIASLAKSIDQKGGRLILRSGDALGVLRDVIAQTGAGAVYWSRLYDPSAIARDSLVKSALRADGVDAQSFGGHVLFEPHTVKTQTGGHFKVYSPMWRAVAQREVPVLLPVPARISFVFDATTDTLDSWGLTRAMNRGGAILAEHTKAGEAAAQDRLAIFIDQGIDGYKDRRDFVDCVGTSNMSEYLAVGEISAAQCWHAGQRAMHAGARGAEHFLKELAWREFAYHLTYHTPHILDQNWREEWSDFGWNTDEFHPDVVAWKQGRTGEPFVDAAMREMYVTGKMHNRARMIVASYLTKHLLCDWRIGQRWFADCLTDWDIAANAMGWQWTAGCGPDAAPYFRVFNPETQAEKFDPKGTYRRRWIAEGSRTPHANALQYFQAVPRSWQLEPNGAYPKPIIPLDAGRRRALAAYETYKSGAVA